MFGTSTKRETPEVKDNFHRACVHRIKYKITKGQLIVG